MKRIPTPHPDPFGSIVHRFAEIGSTNAEAKRLALEGEPEGAVVIAEFQTAGRGRLGRAWESARGKNLTFSLILRPGLELSRAGLVSLYAAVSVASAVRSLADLEAVCKWPNDVLVDGRKTCGILSEAVTSGSRIEAVIIGIGLNVNQTDFPPAIARTATSLAAESGRSFDLDAVLRAVLDSLESRRNFHSDTPAIVAEWLALAPSIGTTVAVSQGGTVIRGVAETVDPDGLLLVRTPDGIRRIAAGDVSHE